MTTINRFILVVSCVFVSATAFAQSTLLLKQADKAMRELDYVTAIALYQQVLDKKEVPEAMVNLAECYRKLSDTENAEFWYAKIVEMPSAKPEHYLYYGMTLQANGRCEAAKPWFLKFREMVPDDVRGQALAKACDQQGVLQTKNEGVYTVGHLPFNSNMDDFAPAIFGNQVVFASDRDKGVVVRRTNMMTGSPFAELYKVRFDKRGDHPKQYRYAYPAKFSDNINTKYHEAAASFSADGRMVFFTRNSYFNGTTERDEQGIVKIQIFSAQAGGEGWNNIQPMPFNSEKYNVAHPSLSPDGQHLFFASDMPGGYGNMDLYVSDWENGRWGMPVNLGPSVNTEGNELFPFAQTDKRLYFASDGHAGLGRLDIFVTTEKKQYEWQNPSNLGAPVNSNRDDFGIVFSPDGNWGFLTSDREGGAGRDDIYGFKKIAVSVAVYAIDTRTNQPVSGATVTTDESSELLQTDVNGTAQFDMRLDTCIQVRLVRKGYKPHQVKVCSKQLTSDTVLRVDMPLVSMSIYVIQGIVLDMNYGLPAVGARLSLANTCGRDVPQNLITGPDGRYHIEVEKECCYTLNAALDGYLSTSSQPICLRGTDAPYETKLNINLVPFGVKRSASITASKRLGQLRFNEQTGFYEDSNGRPGTFDLGDGLQVLNGILYDNGEPVKINKSEFLKSADGDDAFLLNLYYDFDQSNIQEDSMVELQKLLRLLRDNPSITVEIASYTDSRGADDYNLRLSQRRADNIVSWLMRNGISSSRMTAKGYGESKPVKPCPDPSQCSETDHQMNRRTVFYITGKVEQR